METPYIHVGLTGGIGCGKSKVLSAFSERGWDTVDTDKLAHEILKTDPEIKHSLVSKFGEGVLDSQGNVDREQLGGRVFHNPEELAYLESLLHPLVRKAWREKMEDSRRIVVEIPLLFEKDLEVHFTHTLCVVCEERIQEARLRNKGLSNEQISRRKAQQLQMRDKSRRADITLFNNGTVSHLEAQIDWVIEQLKS